MSGSPTYDTTPGASWPPAELSAYQTERLEIGGREARSNLDRFGALAHCLAGGGEPTPGRSVSDKWATDPSLQELKPMTEGLLRGGHIVDVAAGLGEPAAGMLLELGSFGIEGTRYLATDLGQYGNSPDTLDVLAHEFSTLPQEQRIYVDQNSGQDYYSPWSKAYVDRSNWSDLRQRVIRLYGDRWDATDPSFFDRAREALGGEEIGLMLLRHPEISLEPEVFAEIITNLMREALRTRVPLLITTSTNPTSRERIQATIDAFWETIEPDLRAQWESMPWDPPAIISKTQRYPGGERVTDSKAWAIFPKPS